MSQSYFLAQTYEPVSDFAVHFEALNIAPEQFFLRVGLTKSTYTRAMRMRTVSRKTATHIATCYALQHGWVDRETALVKLFKLRPRTIMEREPGKSTYRRREKGD